MDENKPNSQPEAHVNPGVVEQLEQIKKAVPDTSQRLFDFLVQNMKPIAIGCGIIILAAGAYSGFKYWRAAQLAKAADAMGVVLIERADPAARVTGLEEFLKDAPSGLKATGQLELATAAMLAKQYDKAASAWAELEGSPSPDLRVVAGIGHAKCLLLTGKAQEAQALLEGLKAKAPAAYAEAITRQIAVAAEAAGNTPAAAAAYEELAGKAEGSGKPFFVFKANQLKQKS
jgi:predicted negative regulator of RcsB-dependent stress response